MPKAKKCGVHLNETLKKAFEGDPFAEANEKNREAFKRGDGTSIWSKLRRWVFDSQFDVKKALYEEGPEGEVIVRQTELMAGGSAEGGVEYVAAEDAVLAGLTMDELVNLGDLIHAMRIEAIDKNKKIVAQNTIRDGAIGEVLDVSTKEGMGRAKNILGDERWSKMVKGMAKAPGKGTYIAIKVQSKLAKEKFAFQKYKTEEEAQVEADKQIKNVLLDSKVIHPQDQTAEEARRWRVKFYKAEPAIYTKMHNRAKKYFEVFSEQLNLMRREGLISKGDFDNMEKVGDYSPRRYIQYLDPHGEHNALEAITEGSSQAVLRDPAILMREYIVRMHDRIARNRSATELWNFMKSNPDNKIVREAKEVGGQLQTMEGKPLGGMVGKIHVKLDGKSHIMVMRKDLADQWNRFDPIWNSNQMRVMSHISMTPVLKAMATGLNPGFLIVNLPMDIFFSWFRSGKEFSNKAPVGLSQLLGDMWRVRKDVWHTGDKPIGRALKYLKEGGMMSFLTTQGLQKDRTMLSFMITHPKLKAAEKALSFPGQQSELWVRLAVRERVLRNRTNNGKIPETEEMRKEATWIARRYLDFSIKGQYGGVADKFFPYLNAQLRATTGLFETMAKEGERDIALWKLSSFFGLTAAVYVTNMLFHPEMMEGMDDKDIGTYIPIPSPFLDEDTPIGKQRAYFKIKLDPSQAAIQSAAMIIFSRFMKAFNAATGTDLGIDERVWNIREEVLFTNLKNAIPLVGNAPPLFKSIMALRDYDWWQGKPAFKGTGKPPKHQEVNWNTHPLFAKGFEFLHDITGLEASPARIQLAFEQVFTPSNSVLKLANVGSRGFDYVMEQATDAERHEINKAKEFQRAKWMKRFPFANRLVSFAPPVNRESIRKSQELKEEGMAGVQHVKNQVYDLMGELNMMDIDTDIGKKAKDLLIKKSYRVINDSKLTDIQKNTIKRVVKNQVEFKEKIGYLEDPQFWRIVSSARFPSVQARIVHNELHASSKERRESLYSTLQKLPIYNKQFVTEFKLLESQEPLTDAIITIKK